MRIAFRQPDGAWHFANSLTPFTPAGINDISPSASTSELSCKHSSKDGKLKAGYGEEEYGFPIQPTTHPLPAYHRESYHKHFDGDHSPAS